MKNQLTLLLLFSMHLLFAQTAKRDTGLHNGAAYEIQIPENWNNKLVMYAHGYESPATPRNTLQHASVLKVFLDKGFATARSTYSRTGWALPEGVDDTEALRQLFTQKYGKPDSTFMTGHSMGGGITVATIEKYPAQYDGALALCPLSSRPYQQTKGIFDSYAVFNALFPDILPKLGDVMSGKTPSVFIGSFSGKIKIAQDIAQKIQREKPEAVEAYLRHANIRAQDLPFSLMFGDGVIRDLAEQTGGNPFDNTNTYYQGFPDDWTLNQKVERLAATTSNQRLTTYDRTGNIDKPVLILHTSYDVLITPQYGINHYDLLVHEKQKEKNLKVFITNGQGHCVFSPTQTGIAFDALRAWTTTGKKPMEYAIASLPNPKPKDTLCYELRIYTAEKGKLNNLMKRFRNHTTKLFEKHGMTNVGYWTPLDNPDEKLYYVLSYPNREARNVSWKAFMADTVWQRVWKESEVDGKLVAKAESIFLKTTDFSPNDFTGSKSGVWEFRIYTATPNNLETLLSRFRDFTVARFAQYGMGNKAYWTATDAQQGSDKMLYYFLTHPSPDAAKEAFDKFRNDPEWIATRKASEVKGGGSLTVKVESIYMQATDFSKIK